MVKLWRQCRRDMSAGQLRQPDGTLFGYALCEVDLAWTAAAERYGEVWYSTGRTSARTSRRA